MKQWKKLLTIGAAAAFLGGCGGVSEEMLARREAAIRMVEDGEYEEAIAAFDGLVKEADSVTGFELDILKYRAEAEYQLGDYEAAAYTYDILNQVDGERAEYYYFGALSLARAGEYPAAEELLKKGEALKEQPEEETVFAAADFVRAAIVNKQVLELIRQEAYEEALQTAEHALLQLSGAAVQELQFNQAVCYEYLGQWEKALSLFEGYTAAFGSDERAEHEIAFLKTR